MLTGMELPARATACASCSPRVLASARRPAAASRRHSSPAHRASSRQPELWTPDQGLIQVSTQPIGLSVVCSADSSAAHCGNQVTSGAQHFRLSRGLSR